MTWSFKNRIQKSLLPTLGLAAALFAPNVAQAALVNVSGLIENPNASIGAGNTANLVGNASFWWNTGTTSIDVITNGFTFTLDSGGGNAFNYNGSISGDSEVHFRHGPAASGCCANSIMNIGGATSNSYTGTSYIEQGIVRLQKTGGATAIAGNVIIGGQGNNDILMLGASDQIADTSFLSFTGNTTATFNVNGFSETVGIVQVSPNGVINLGAGGSLTTKLLNDNGSWISPGTYNAGDLSFLTGTGTLTVQGGGLPPAGNSIALNFSGDGIPGGRKVISGATLAGATGYEQLNWNNTPGLGQVGPPSSSANDNLFNLVDSNGFITSLDIQFRAAQTWGADFGSNPTGDQQLNGSGITDGTPTVQVFEIPFSEFDVVVYIGEHAARNSTVTLTAEDGTVFERFVTMPNFSDFTDWDEVSENATSPGARELGNYIVFSGLTGSSFTVSATQGGFTGIQIVNTAVTVPEPATAMLLSIAVTGLAMARRNRRESVLA